LPAPLDCGWYKNSKERNKALEINKKRFITKIKGVD
jgi:hypothetical protein